MASVATSDPALLLALSLSGAAAESGCDGSRSENSNGVGLDLA